MRNVRKDYMIHQRHLRDGVLAAQVTSTFAISFYDKVIKSFTCTRD